MGLIDDIVGVVDSGADAASSAVDYSTRNTDRFISGTSVTEDQARGWADATGQQDPADDDGNIGIDPTDYSANNDDPGGGDPHNLAEALAQLAEVLQGFLNVGDWLVSHGRIVVGSIVLFAGSYLLGQLFTVHVGDGE